MILRFNDLKDGIDWNYYFIFAFVVLFSDHVAFGENKDILILAIIAMDVDFG